MRREIPRVLGAALALTLLPWCGAREPGLEVELDLVGAPTEASGMLDIARIELLACPDDPRTAARAIFAPTSAHAHDITAPSGAMSVTFPDARGVAIVGVLPGSYCDVRVQLGDPDHAALVTPMGAAVERELVLRLVDDEGTPTRLVLAAPPDRARVQIELGAFGLTDSPEHAISRLFDTAAARVLR